MQRFALTLDLKNDPELIKQYIDYHRNVWPEIKESISASGIREMEIYHVHTRLFMYIIAEDGFSFQKKAQLDNANSKVQQWEKLMDQYQERLPFAQKNVKWVLMDKIFQL